MWIDHEEGTNKMFCLVIAIIVSVLYTFLAFCSYKRNDDYYLAFVSICQQFSVDLLFCFGALY